MPSPYLLTKASIVGKIMKEQGFADAGLGRDLTHGAVFVRVLRKDPVAGVENSLLLFLRQGKEFGIHAVPPLTVSVNAIIKPLTDFEKTPGKIFFAA